ncbi:hypothetical protein B0H16DRAFT_1776130 [Mycena metata]|uniref:Uncharacterized protein n=1 Tax=Mycena metata TaxID=1033252 RepID=A0AAD7HVK2_9AGAR|nr:hypothetical protein B0H16DRAFT_1776130 [Mycena metata]
MPLISPAGFPIAYRLGYRGGKVEARKKPNDDIRAIAIALNPPPNTWLPRAYQDHWLGSPTVRVSAHNFSQWFQRCDIRVHKDCSKPYHPTSGAPSHVFEDNPRLRELLLARQELAATPRRMPRLSSSPSSVSPTGRPLERRSWPPTPTPEQKTRRCQTRFSSPIVPSAGPSSAPTAVRDPATPNFGPTPFPALPAPHGGLNFHYPVSHYSADGHIVTTSSTVVADPASDVFGSSAQLPSPVAENTPAREASVISVSSASSDTAENLELAYPPGEAITFNLVRSARLVVWTHDPRATRMTVYGREVGQAYSELVIRDYRHNLLAIGFNVNIPGEMFVEI